MHKILRWVVAAQIVGIAFVTASAQLPNCPLRPNAGTVVLDPLSLSSQNAALQLALTMRTSVDSGGFTHYCFDYQTSTGEIEAPTLRLNPGDTLTLSLTNKLNTIPAAYPARAAAMADMKDMHSAVPSTNPCTEGPMNINSTNVHFHGLNIPPICHQDDVINTIIEPNTPAFQYQIQIPTNEPPGLYWYHPHPHGYTTLQVNGGASGAIIVGGIEKVKPQVAGLTERVLIVRQQFLNPGSWLPGPNQITLNFQPAVSPQLPAPQIVMAPGEKQFWRVLNASTQAFLALQVWYVTTPQPLELISVDAVPVTNDPTVTTINLPPAGRAEFIVQAPPSGTTASFVDVGFDTGPAGNPNTAQTLASITTSSASSAVAPHPVVVPAAVSTPSAPQRFSNLANVKPTTTRQLYFSEATEGSNGPTGYFLTVAGQQPKLFKMTEPPAIVTQVGAVEDWTIENHSSEEHAFHMHQIHFLVMAVNGVALNPPVMQDTVNVPYWTGKGAYPTVTVRMDFRDPEIAGTFVYHCHILDHEDGGMMEKIQVNP